jgi:hypothetical protein
MISILIRTDKNREGGLTRNLPLRLDISFKIWLYESKPLLYAALNISAALLHVSENCKANKRYNKGRKRATYFSVRGKYPHLLRKISEFQINT